MRSGTTTSSQLANTASADANSAPNTTTSSDRDDAGAQRRPSADVAGRSETGGRARAGPAAPASGRRTPARPPRRPCGRRPAPRRATPNAASRHSARPTRRRAAPGCEQQAAQDRGDEEVRRPPRPQRPTRARRPRPARRTCRRPRSRNGSTTAASRPTASAAPTSRGRAGRSRSGHRLPNSLVAGRSRAGGGTGGGGVVMALRSAGWGWGGRPGSGSPGGVGHLDPAAVQLGDPAGDRQAEAGAAVRRRRRW